MGLINVLFGGSSAVNALPEDRQQPIHLEADRAQLDQNTGTSIYEGNVVISQGSMRLTADKVTVYIQEGQLSRMEAQGTPVTLRYKPTVDQDEVHGQSLRLDYDAKTATAVMTQNAKITQGQDTFIGERVEYQLNNNIVKASGKEGSRIQFIIQPREIKTTPEKAPARRSN